MDKLRLCECGYSFCRFQAVVEIVAAAAGGGGSGGGWNSMQCNATAISVRIETWQS